jgi:hypothetical protein
MRVWNSAKGELLTYLNFQVGITSLGLHPSVPQIVFGQIDGSMYIMDDGRSQLWTDHCHYLARPIERFYHIWLPKLPHLVKDSESNLGSEFPCSLCSKTVKINPFTIEGDWRTVSKAV